MRVVLDLTRANDVLTRAYPRIYLEDIGGRAIIEGRVDKNPGETIEQTLDRLFEFVDREVAPHLPPDSIGLDVVQDGDNNASGSSIEEVFEPRYFRPLAPGKVIFHSGS